jgi:hypothetical protein
MGLCVKCLGGAFQIQTIADVKTNKTHFLSQVDLFFWSFNIFYGVLMTNLLVVSPLTESLNHEEFSTLPKYIAPTKM